MTPRTRRTATSDTIQIPLRAPLVVNSAAIMVITMIAAMMVTMVSAVMVVIFLMFMMSLSSDVVVTSDVNVT